MKTKSRKTNISVKIRPFHMNDYDAVIVMWKTCGLLYKPKGRNHHDKILKEITNKTATFLVAEINNQLIGTVLATHDGRKGWINRLAVSPEFQHLGIAQKLLKEAEQAIQKKGIEIIACLIGSDNQRSMDFFQKAGYTKHCDFIYFSKLKHPEV